MRCEPGDLVVVVRRADESDPRDDIFIGAVRKLTTMHGDCSWLYEGEVLRCPERGGVQALADHALRPLRWDNGKDESFAWKRPILRLQVREMK